MNGSCCYIGPHIKKRSRGFFKAFRHQPWLQDLNFNKTVVIHVRMEKHVGSICVRYFFFLLRPFAHLVKEEYVKKIPVLVNDIKLS